MAMFRAGLSCHARRWRDRRCASLWRMIEKAMRRTGVAAPASSLAVVVVLLAGTARPAAAEPLVTHRIPASLGAQAVTEAVAACAKQGYAVSANIIDVDARRVAMLRGDGAGAHTDDVSWGKAYAAVSYAPIYGFDSSRAAAGRQQPPDAPPFQPPEHMVLRGGGLTIKFGGEVIGAIGVSGSPGAAHDEACARAGLDKIRDSIR
jgi:uncharacterized protein GlcG (DUF336 family)